MAETAINLAASFFSYSATSGTKMWAPGVLIPSEFLVEKRLQRRLTSVTIYSTGRVRIEVSAPSQDDFTDAVENNGVFTLAAGAHSVDFGILGADIADPYDWTPANAAEIIAFYNAIGTANVAGVFTLRDVPHVIAPEFADDTGDAAAWTTGRAIAAITVPAATGIPAPAYAVVGNLPDGIAFDPATRRITGAPSAPGAGTIRIRATNSQGSDDWTLAYRTVGIAVPSLRAGRPYIEVQLAERVDIAVPAVRAGRPRIEALVEQPIYGASLRAGRPYIEVEVVGGITASLRAGRPYIEAVLAADIAVPSLRAGRPRIEAIVVGDIFATLRAGRPRIEAIVVGDIFATLRAGRPRIFAAVGNDPQGSLRAGSPRIEAVVEAPVFASLRAGRPRIEAVLAADIAVPSLRAGRPYIEAIVVGDIFATLRAGRPYIFVSAAPLPSELLGFHTVLGDNAVEVQFEEYLDPAGHAVTYELQIDDGSWVPFVPTRV